MFSGFAYQQFGRERDAAQQDAPERCFECDLLIIDDLGTEMINQFTVSSLYNLINTRLNMGKPTIISTNFSQSELRQSYCDRITSRLFGEYLPVVFRGKDIRMQKIEK